MKKVLVVGGGAREHAIIDALARGPNPPEQIFAAPGNPGIAKLATCLSYNTEDISQLTSWANKERPDLTIVGPEVPLALGIVDQFNAAGLPIFGPTRAAARLEWSKAFACGMLSLIGDANFVPDGHIYFTAQDAMMGLTIDWDVVWEHGGVVVKADGLAAGKGVIIAPTKKEAEAAIKHIMIDQAFGEAGDVILIQEFVAGRELSAFILTDGVNVRWFGEAQDFKRLRNGDQGPNTGGMGAIAPVPWVTDNLRGEILESIARPLVRAMANEGRPYQGVLFLGLMIEPNGHPVVLEVNCRFGDPETQVLLERFDGDLLELLAATTNGRLADVPEPRFRIGQCAVCVTLAANGYPQNVCTGEPIFGIDKANFMEGVRVYHGGTSQRNPDSAMIVSGGRALSVVATGATFEQARGRVYPAIATITFQGMQFRTDIGAEYIVIPNR
ncbi:MAG: phosphoribosylamine--glycine ligase [Ilumatobacteraceae bacterium]